MTVGAGSPQRQGRGGGLGARSAEQRRWPVIRACLVLVALTFVVYIPAFSYDFRQHEGFVWDDDNHFIRDHLVQADDGWWRIWADPEPGAVWNYWPLTRFSFWIERRLWGVNDQGLPNLRGYHVFNVLLHALNAAGVFIVLRMLGLRGAWLAAAVFAVHPVTVESVAWITQRKAVLSTFFMLIALATYLRWLVRRRAGWYLASIAAFLLALLAKTTTVMFPPVLVLLHWYLRRPWTPRGVLALVPFFALSVIMGVVSIIFERFIGSSGEEWGAGLPERLAAAGMITWFYLGKVLVPIGLSFNYPRWSIDPSSAIVYLPSAAVLVVAIGLWAFRRGRGRPLCLALGTFLINLFPVLGFLNIYGMRYAHVADHWQYVACLSVIALTVGLVAAGVDRLASGRPAGTARAVRVAGAAVAAVVLVALGWLTWQQASAYRDRETLWRHTLEREPSSWIAHTSLGLRLVDRGALGEAEEHFRLAIEAAPDAPDAHVNMGNLALTSTGDVERAVQHWQDALAIEPGNIKARFKAHFNLGLTRLRQGRHREATEHLRRALETQPRAGVVLEPLHQALTGSGRVLEWPRYAQQVQSATAAHLAGGRRIMLPAWACLAAAVCAGLVVGLRDPGEPREPRG